MILMPKKENVHPGGALSPKDDVQSVTHFQGLQYCM